MSKAKEDMEARAIMECAAALKKRRRTGGSNRPYYETIDTRAIARVLAYLRRRFVTGEE